MTQHPAPQHDPNADRPTWANPVDAPPPFPNAGTPYSNNPYAGSNPYGTQNHAGVPSGYHAYQPNQRAAADDRMWAIMAHLSAPIATIVSAGWLNIVGPLVVWILKKDSSPYVRNASAGAFNFTITMWLMTLVGWLLTMTFFLAIIGIPMIVIGSLGSIILGIVGAIKSSNGESYTYPWQMKVLS